MSDGLYSNLEEDQSLRSKGGRLGVFPMGTFDGLPAQPPFGHVLIRGEAVPVIGRTLQHTILDLCAQADAQEGAIVTLAGAQGERSISIFDLAESLKSNVTDLHFKLVQRLGKRSLDT